ncbi:MAG: SIMPL domain-containing protein [Pseudopedobacter saltans]|uniref:SIMPL domain-containing protein n=1 Tax=Pseudopedobacter saltans TaxID=151895 RepID=A0A2W5F9Y1_9SPHI|nr:MAG: SIMPL domain-containing protein [Pseudopedobacter saltans]
MSKININTVIIAIAVVLFAFIGKSAYKYKFKEAQTISVTGLAEKDFDSDLIVWTGNYSKTGSDLKSVYAELKRDENTIRQYLLKKGVANGDIIFTAIDISKNFETQTDENNRSTSVFSGYTLTQTVKVESKDVDKVEAVSREVTELIESDIAFTSAAPAYYYSKLAELKLDLLSKASADAKSRANSIAENAGAKIGDLRSASMGIFQITGKNSNEDYSYGGTFNTSSRKKTASITMRSEYLVR